MERNTYVRKEDGVDGVTEERVETRASTDTYHDPVVQDSVVERRHSAMFYDSIAGRINSVLMIALLALEGLLALRFLLVAFGANRESGFVEFIMDLSWPFVRPFDGAFANRTWDEGVIEVSTLLAMGVWFLGFALVMMLINALMPRFTSSDDVRHSRVTHA